MEYYSIFEFFLEHDPSHEPDGPYAGQVLVNGSKEDIVSMISGILKKYNDPKKIPLTHYSLTMRSEKAARLPHIEDQVIKESGLGDKKYKRRYYTEIILKL